MRMLVAIPKFPGNSRVYFHALKQKYNIRKIGSLFEVDDAFETQHVEYTKISEGQSNTSDLAEHRESITKLLEFFQQHKTVLLGDCSDAERVSAIEIFKKAIGLLQQGE